MIELMVDLVDLIDVLEVFQITAVLLLALFLPCTAFAYWQFGWPVRKREMLRVFDRLKISQEEFKRYSEKGLALALASGFSVLPVICISVLAMLGEDFPNLDFGGVDFDPALV